MSKMRALIANELIKIFSRVSTYILLGITLLIMLGISLVSTIDLDAGIFDYDAEQLNNENIEYYTKCNDKLEVEYYTFIRDNGIDIYGSTDTWVTKALDYAYNSALQARSENGKDTLYCARALPYLDFIKHNDYVGYYRLLLQSIDISSPEGQEYAYRIDNNLPEDGGVRSDNLSDITKCRTALLQAQSKGIRQYIVNAENNLALAQYRFDNNISYYIINNDGVVVCYAPIYNNMLYMQNILPIIYVFLIVIAGSIVAAEFGGSIKLLLVNPVKRSKIFISKYLTVLLLCIGLCLVMFFVCLTVPALFGVLGFDAATLSVVNGNVTATSGFATVAGIYALASVSPIMLATLAFMLSSVSRSSGLAIAFGIVSVYMGSTIIDLLYLLTQWDFLRYSMFSNLDLYNILCGNSMFYEHTVPFALCVLAVHMVVLLLTAWDGFMRRDVK